MPTLPHDELELLRQELDKRFGRRGPQRQPRSLHARSREVESWLDASARALL